MANQYTPEPPERAIAVKLMTRGQATVAEIATHYGVHPTQVTLWKKQALDHLREAFSDGRKRHERADAELQGELYQQIGQLKVELDWLKKKAGLLS